MRSSLLGLLVGVALVAALAAAPAQAKNCGTHTVAPPGNSGVNQYVEHVPTACGDKPSNKVQGGVGGGGGAGGAGGSGSGGGISASTARQLAKLGAAGQAAAAFAKATSPGHAGKNGRGSASVSSASTGDSGSSPISSLVRALTGSSSGGGLGTFLPILLIASVIGLGGIALLRRRRAT
jgi:hypothetical protein